MNTLADAKRRIKVGMVVDVTNHRFPNLTGKRTVTHAQTAKFAMTIPGEERSSWLDWPAAAGLRIDGPNTVTFLTRIPGPDPTEYLSERERRAWYKAHETWGDPFCTIVLPEQEL